MLEISFLVKNQLLVKECYINKKDFLCMRLSAPKESKSIVIEFDPYWRLEKEGVLSLGSLDEDRIIADTLPLLKDRQIIDFSINKFLDLSLFFKGGISLTVFRGRSDVNLQWKKSLEEFRGQSLN